MKWEHDDWFVKQFGKRPTTITPIRLDEQIRGLQLQINDFKELRRKAEIWDEQWRASRYAWSIGQAGDLKKTKAAP